MLTSYICPVRLSHFQFTAIIVGFMFSPDFKNVWNYEQKEDTEEVVLKKLQDEDNYFLELFANCRWANS